MLRLLIDVVLDVCVYLCISGKNTFHFVLSKKHIKIKDFVTHCSLNHFHELLNDTMHCHEKVGQQLWVMSESEHIDELFFNQDHLKNKRIYYEITQFESYSV